MVNGWPEFDLPAALAARLNRPLPGPAAQRAMSHTLAYGRHFGPAPDDVRRAAVTVLLYPADDGGWCVPLTLRAPTLEDHAGQISFPGGAIDPGETDEHCAARELAEELGVASGDLMMLGRLSPVYLYASNFHVTPWIASLPARPAFAPNPAEVAELLEAPLTHLLEPAARGRHARRMHDVEFSTPHFAWEGHFIWGATGMILAELVAVVAESLAT